MTDPITGWFAAGARTAPARSIHHPLAGRPYHTDVYPPAVAVRLTMLRLTGRFQALAWTVQAAWDHLVATFGPVLQRLALEFGELMGLEGCDPPPGAPPRVGPVLEGPLFVSAPTLQARGPRPRPGAARPRPDSSSPSPEH